MKQVALEAPFKHGDAEFNLRLEVTPHWIKAAVDRRQPHALSGKAIVSFIFPTTPGDFAYIAEQLRETGAQIKDA